MSRIAGRALTALFTPADRDPSSTSYYDSFVAHLGTSAGQREIGTAFPVLPTLLEDSARRWVGALAELLERLANDAHNVATRIGGRWDRISSLRGGLGDSHRHGRTVWRVIGSDGTSVAYKPRPLAPELLVYEQLTAMGAPAPAVVDSRDYGWVEWLESTPVTDIEKFWTTVGRVAAICYLEGAGDLHYGNVIVYNNGIVPIDLECVMQPGRDPEDPLAEGLADSILSTGLFPGWFGQDGPVARDNSGLFGRRNHTDGRRYQVWDGLGTDGLRMVEILGTGLSDGEPARLPDGHAVPVDRAALGASLEATLDHLGTSQADPQARIEPRHLVRHTGVYARQIAQLLDPENLADPSAFSSAASDLPDLPDRFVDRIDASGEEALVQAEAAALRRLDVPLHRSRGRDLLLDDGTILPKVFDRSGADRRRRRAQRLHTTPGRFHRELVAIHLDHGVGFEGPRSLAPRPLQSPKDAIRSLADHLQATAVGDVDSPAWLELELGAGGTQATGRIGSTSLYDGTAGVAMAFAASAFVHNDSQLGDYAIKLLDTTEQRATDRSARAAADDGGSDATAPMLDQLSWPSQDAGLAAARFTVGQILNRSDLIETASSRLCAMLATPMTSGDRLDVVGGWAGLLSVGLAAFAATDDDQLGAQLSERVTELVKEAQRQMTHAVTGRRIAGLGVAHRGSGLGLVAARAGMTLDHSGARQLAQDIFAREDVRIERRNGVGAAMQRAGNRSLPRPGWCAGIAGYLAVRTSPWVAELHDTPLEHFEASLEALSEPLAENRAGLCCGDAGLLMALTHAANTISLPAVTEFGATYQSRLVELAAGSAPISIVPGYAHHGACLHMGLGGLAYALAHRCEPSTIPNLLFVA